MQYIELFHLLFLDHFGRKVDRQTWALKGGCNLRFFFSSVRYSEDMDLDLGDLPEHVLKDRVEGILASKPFRDVLSVRHIIIEHVTAAKQTATTQRWKIGLLTPEAVVPLPTKIEFSRRGLKEGVEFDAVNPELIRSYELSPLRASHYGASAALQQKLNALVGRTAAQARDIFDLHVLLPHVTAASLELPPGISLTEIEERALAMNFGVFKSQVISFLPAEQQARYDDPRTWDAIVLGTLEDLRRLLQ